ncbi:MAG: class I SAM-dependent methyltransferase [Planctomycetota bacterium]
MDSIEFNRDVWDRIARSPKRWFTPVTEEEITQAREGDFRIRLTGTRCVPPDWIGDVDGKRVLALAAGGGHQAVLLAAAGADVTVVDFSEGQLEHDRSLAQRYGLALKTCHADMREMKMLETQSFDLVVNPCSVNFVPDCKPVWKEAARVMRDGAALIAGMIQPVNFLFDAVSRDRGKLQVRFRIPYSDLDLPRDEREETLGPERPIDFGHSLADLIGGQTASGLMLTDLLEDVWGGDDPLSERIGTFLITRSEKHSRPSSSQN